jgi:hypothetical protein
MPDRKVSARTRFEIFKRDGFRCVYCGATPLNKPLHADHVVALANGGSNAASNLVTACGDCNQGKAAVPLERKALAVSIANQADRDHAKQILEYLAIQREVEKSTKYAADVLAKRWEEIVGPMTQGMYDRLEPIMREWNLEQIDAAMQVVARKMGTAGEPFESGYAVKQAKYFHGVLRRWREEGQVS